MVGSLSMNGGRMASMPYKRTLSSLLLVSAAAGAQSGVDATQYTYTWPYGANNECKCEAVSSEQRVLGKPSFASEIECLEAFAIDTYEECQFEGKGGIEEDQCESAVSVAEGITNGDCSVKCTDVVAGILSLAEFRTECRFEYVVDFQLDYPTASGAKGSAGNDMSLGVMPYGQRTGRKLSAAAAFSAEEELCDLVWEKALGAFGVAPLPGSCYTNYVYGYKSYDPANTLQAKPLRVFPHVSSPVACQSLCQRIDDCVFFNWKNADVSAPEGSQDADHECLLFDQTYVNAVLALTVDEELIAAGPSAFCDVSQAKDCATQVGSQLLTGNDKCLLCGCEAKCVWKEPQHITGPAFCLPAVSEDSHADDDVKASGTLCQISRPSWTTTPAPCDTTEADFTTPVASTTEGGTSTSEGPDFTTPPIEEGTSTTAYTTPAPTQPPQTTTTLELSSTPESTTTIELSSTTAGSTTTIELSETSTGSSTGPTRPTETSPVVCPPHGCPEDLGQNDAFVMDDFAFGRR